MQNCFYISQLLGNRGGRLGRVDALQIIGTYGRDHVIVSLTSLDGVVRECGGCYERSVYLRVGSARLRRTIGVIAAHLRRTAGDPVEGSPVRYLNPGAR